MSDMIPKGGIAPLVPELDVCDLARSLAFWCDGLGFRVAYARRETGFAFLQRERAQIMLEQVNGNWVTAPMTRPFGRGINLQITVECTEDILTRLSILDWPLFRPLHDAWYRAGEEEVGCRQFLVQDPDGYLLRFCESLGRRRLSPGGPASSH